MNLTGPHKGMQRRMKIYNAPEARLDLPQSGLDTPQSRPAVPQSEFVDMQQSKLTQVSEAVSMHTYIGPYEALKAKLDTPQSRRDTL